MMRKLYQNLKSNVRQRSQIDKLNEKYMCKSTMYQRSEAIAKNIVNPDNIKLKYQ